MTKDDEKTQTIKTYDRFAKKYFQRFNEIGVRKKEIKKAFSYIKRSNPKTIELGCGNGRDAKEILKYTDDYLGLDLSENLLQIAKQNVPEANFKLADFETFRFPKGLDVIIAFSCLFHSDRKSIKAILKRACKALNPGGVFIIFSKYGKYHKEIFQRKSFGPKVVYYYTSGQIDNLSPSELRSVYRDIYTFEGKKWFTTILRKSA